MWNANSMMCFRQCQHYFVHELFPVVPLDSCLRSVNFHTPGTRLMPLHLDESLWQSCIVEEILISHGRRLFVRTLDRYPLDASRTVGSPSDGVEQRFNNLTLDSSLETAQESEKRIYPPRMVDVIDCAIAGMAYVYFRPTLNSLTPYTKVPRTKYTPYSAKTFRTKGYSARAIFLVPWYSHLQRVFSEDKLVQDTNWTTPNRMLQPYDKREEEWLEAFLIACDYMARMGR